MSDEIQNEEDFQAHLMKEYESKFGMYGSLYPKVNRISGKDISPDIDLLYIDYSSKALTGYEFKFLRYKKNEPNYRRIREELGEAISYFQFGVDRSYLVLGLQIGTSDLVEAQANKTVDMISELKNRLKMNCLGIMLWCQNSSKKYHLKPYRHVQPTKDFPQEPSTPQALFDISRKLNRSCIFDKRFHYSHKFLQKYGLHEPTWRPKGY